MGGCSPIAVQLIAYLMDILRWNHPSNQKDTQVPFVVGCHEELLKHGQHGRVLLPHVFSQAGAQHIPRSHCGAVVHLIYDLRNLPVPGVIFPEESALTVLPRDVGIIIRLGHAGKPFRECCHDPFGAITDACTRDEQVPCVPQVLHQCVLGQ